MGLRSESRGGRGRRGRRAARNAAAAIALLALSALPAAATAAEPRLTDRLGRSDVRVLAAPYPLAAGVDVAAAGLPQRLERTGYRRVHRRPQRPGEYFWGTERFWIYRRAHRSGGDDHPPRLFALILDGGRVRGASDDAGAPADPAELWLEPELLAESLTGDRAPRRPVPLAELPERVWRPVLAAEDARFFEHGGVDGRSIARAALANLLAGGIEQGGSTITQQLIKMRDLTPKRSFGRKVSEAVRSLALEAEHPKEEILEAYLDHVYLGHVDGVAVHGIGAAARVYFSKDARRLSLGEAALLAAVIQGPNRLSPLRHPERAEARRSWVLDRLAELGWASAAEIAEARRPPRLRPTPPVRREAGRFVRWVGEIAADAAARRIERGRGVVIETTLDPYLQALAESAVEEGLAALRRDHPQLGRRPLTAALVALDPADGTVVAYVGGDPAAGGDRFDRARSARRQPGSTVKPLALLEAFEDCGGRQPLYPGSRVADEPLTVELPSGPWSPDNDDDRFRGVVTVRRALVDSLNVPLARIALWCGVDDTAARARRSGLELPDEAPPSFVLGSVETTPLHLAEAFTVFATPGRALRPYPVRRIERPAGSALAAGTPGPRRVVDPATAWLVRDLLRDVVDEGTARAAAVPGLGVAAKTGTSSGARDAWLAGDAGNLVTVVWVGLDDASPLGLSGAAAAAPIWRRFVAAASPARPPRTVERPDGVVEGHLDPATGRRVRAGRPGARPELFRRGALPPHRRLWRADPPLPVVR